MKTSIRPVLIAHPPMGTNLDEPHTYWYEPRRGIDWAGQFCQFPDDPADGPYTLVEHLNTNSSGYYTGTPSRYEIRKGTPAEAVTYYTQHCISGIIHAVATFEYRHHRISRWTSCHQQILRKHG